MYEQIKEKPEDYILKEHLGFNWKNRLNGNEYDCYMSYKNADNYVEQKDINYWKLVYSHLFIRDFSNHYINLPLSKFVKKKPKRLKHIDYLKHI